MKNSGLTEKQIEMLKKKFDKGYTLTQFAEDLELTKHNYRRLGRRGFDRIN